MELFTLHSKGKNLDPMAIEASEVEFAYFARSNLSKVGRSRNRQLFVAGEKAVLPVVELTVGIRRTLLATVDEELLRWLDANRSKLRAKGDPRPDLPRLDILFALRDGLKNSKYRFLQRLHT